MSYQPPSGYRGYAPYQPPPPPKRHTLRNVVLGVVIGIFGLIAIGAVISAGSGTGDGNGTQVGATTQATTILTQPASTKAATSAAPATVALKITGSGIKSTQDFATGSEWQIAYSYDCTKLGYAGNFQVFVYTDGQMTDLPVNALDTKGSDTTYEHDSPGTHYLEINSECTWTVTVTTN